MGKLIVIEGLDGAGKATQSAALCEAMRARGQKVRALTFPRYESDSSALVRMYLRGDFGSRPGDVGCYAASAFYAVDRVASFLDDWREDYLSPALLVADRYTTSNAVYQAAKLAREERGSFLDWLEDFEYRRLGLPRPDAVFYLDMPVEVSEALLSVRYAADEDKNDIHERDAAFQRACREAAALCARRGGWRIINCASNGAVRPVADISAELLAGALEILGEYIDNNTTNRRAPCGK